MPGNGEVVPGSAALPPELWAAVLRYERALLENDLAAIDAAFVDSDDTLRGDAAGLLVGMDEIRAFRGARGGIPARRTVRVEHRSVARDAVLVVAVSRYADGGDGLQTQLWVRRSGVWRITAAHVTARPSAFDRSVWRVLGDPLVPGAASGPLAGLRVAVKDVFAVAGFAVGAGVPAHLAESPTATRTAPAVQTLLDAGAAILGIARTDEFAYSLAGVNEHYGTPPNARVPSGLPGGSTSGPASAVASGHAEVGLGTDTGGSIRIPASYQGIWGLRTTLGTVDTTGMVPLAPSFDTVGWLARDPATLRTVAATTFGDEARSTGDLVRPADLAGVDPEVAAGFDEFVLGARPVRLPDPDALLRTFRVVQQAEAWAQHGEWIRAHPGALGPVIAARFRLASEVSEEAAAAARRDLRDLRDRIREAVGGDVLALPSAPGAAPRRDTPDAALAAVRDSTLALTAVAGIGGLPAVAVPALSSGGHPVGLSLIGPPGSDLALVDAAVRLVPSKENR